MATLDYDNITADSIGDAVSTAHGLARAAIDQGDLHLEITHSDIRRADAYDPTTLP